ncbi:MAG: hypothetical protein K6E50_11240 [Lachnospiraceae bacterium]|nr:hypothetical protein [Lachnospiraceae bacterium]
MAIGMVEMQGMINRTQDFQQLQHHENEKGMIYQTQQQEQVDQNADRFVGQVHKKDNAGEDNSAEGGDGKRYADNGKKGGKKPVAREEGRIVKKNTMAFDIKI